MTAFCSDFIPCMYSVSLSQAEISYYRLELRPGYRHQYNDCMVCDHTGGPLILRRDSLLPDSPRSLATLDTALTTRRPMLACPDMMFFTRYCCLLHPLFTVLVQELYRQRDFECAKSSVATLGY